MLFEISNVIFCVFPLISCFLYITYYNSAIDLVEFKIYESLPAKPKMKPPKDVCSIFFENKGLEFI